jgi:hypothetical protein
VPADVDAGRSRQEAGVSLREWLEIVVVPIILVVIALVWPLIHSWHRSRTFTRLIFRELEEIGPYPKETERDHWGEHLSRKFVHRTVLKEVSVNRDFVLSLDADLIYKLTQLWDAYEAKDEKQWLHYLAQLAELDETGKLRRVHADWNDLCDRYRRKGRTG